MIFFWIYNEQKTAETIKYFVGEGVLFKTIVYIWKYRRKPNALGRQSV